MSAPTFEPRRRELLLAAMAVLSGCGGVDSGGTGTGASSTYASGPITGFGSIIVNGVRFDDTDAFIDDDDGSIRSRVDLKLGMRTEVIASAVAVSGGVSSATAASIRLRREIVGPLEAVDAARGLLTVLGQHVNIVATTVFDSAIVNGIAALVPGELLEIHATLDVAAGRYVASRIERRASAAAYRLRGAVLSLSLAARTLTMGSATIDWSAVAPTDPANALALGHLVQVTLETTPIAAGVWRASALVANLPPPEDRDFVEVEGRITAFTSPASFMLNGLAVDASTAAFPNGSAGLGLGTKIEATGSLRNGVLLASQIRLEDDEGGPEAFELSGNITSVDTAAMQFVVRGVTVMWSASTRFDGGTAANIVPGRRVEAKGRLSTNGSLIEATSVHFD